jgi:hypothetical protein
MIPSRSLTIREIREVHSFGRDNGNSLSSSTRNLPPPKAASKSGRALFSGRRSQVVHALLTKPNQWLGVKELAQGSLVSSATTSQVLTAVAYSDNEVEERAAKPFISNPLRDHLIRLCVGRKLEFMPIGKLVCFQL